MLRTLQLAGCALAALTLAAPAMADHHKMDGQKPAYAQGDIPATVVEAAAADSQFSTLVAAVKAAGLAETLSGEGPFTVFAPTDEAFAALPPGTLDDLLKPENKEKLQAILTYHVVPQRLTSKDIPAGTTQVPTVNGQSLSIEAEDSGVTVNGATVIATDVKTGNGIIHVIDSVVLPQ